MTNDQTNQFNMQERVGQFLTAKQEIIKDIQAIIDVHSELQSNTAEIRNLIQLVESTKSLTAAKNSLEEKIVSGILKLAGALAAHAATTSDEKLASLGAVTATSLKNLRDTNLIDTAQKHTDTAAALVNELTPWGVAQSDVDALNSDKKTFQESIGEVGNQQGTNSSTNGQIKDKLSGNQSLLKTKLDKLILPFKTINPAFHAEYLTARQILDLGGSHSSTDTSSAPQSQQQARDFYPGQSNSQ